MTHIQDDDFIIFYRIEHEVLRISADRQHTHYLPVFKTSYFRKLSDQFDRVLDTANDAIGGARIVPSDIEKDLVDLSESRGGIANLHRRR